MQKLYFQARTPTRAAAGAEHVRERSRLRVFVDYGGMTGKPYLIDWGRFADNSGASAGRLGLSAGWYFCRWGTPTCSDPSKCR